MNKTIHYYITNNKNMPYYYCINKIASLINITDIESEVTCKRCIKKLNEG